MSDLLLTNDDVLVHFDMGTYTAVFSWKHSFLTWLEVWSWFWFLKEFSRH